MNSAIKRNEFLPFAATWIELESIMLNEISQSDKDKYHRKGIKRLKLPGIKQKSHGDKCCSIENIANNIIIML